MKRMIGLFMVVMLVMTVVAGCSDDAVKGDVAVVDETTTEDSTSELTDDTGKMETDEQTVEDGDLVAADELEKGGTSDAANAEGWEGMVSDFEDDQHGWLPRMGSEALTLSDTSHTGSKSIEVSNRGESYEGIKIPLLGKMVAKESYDIEAWVYQASGSAEEIVMTMEKNEGSPTYTRMGGAQTESGNWHKITASYTLVENGTVTELSLYFEAANAELVFNVDDVSIKPKAPEAVKAVQMELQSIHEVYSEHFSVGVAIGDNFLKDSRMKDLIGLHFNSITAENSMKPEPMLDNTSRGHINFLMADQYNAYAKTIDAGLRGHALVWHNQTPDWFFKEDYSDDGALVSREVMLERMEEYIEEVIKRYDASTLYAWDVVNEAIDPSEDDNMRRSLWYKVVGPDFVEKAFEYARKHTEGSDVKLYYNDYSVVSDINKRMAIYDLCMDLKAKGLIDGVGLQSHISISGPGPKAFEDTIRLFGDAGLDVQITELDISIYENDSQTYTEVPDELLIRQAYRYKKLFEVFVDNSDVVSNVTVWGLLDTQSWLNYFPVPRKNWPLFFDGEYQAKYAYYGVTDPSLLPEDVKPVELREPAYEAKAVQGTPVIDGTMDGSWDMADSLQVNHYILGETGATAVAKTMYDKEYLYVLVEVSDDTPGTSSENPWEQDSVEVFMDEDMGRTSEYGPDDGQYRVSRDNTVTVNGPVGGDKVFSAVTEVSGGYMVEIAIPFQSGAKSPREQIGFDIQVNDDQGGGKRDSFTKWNDVTDNGWKSTEGFGSLTFK